MDEQLLNWGAATPEATTEDPDEAIHVINHALQEKAQLVRNIAFIRARVAYFAKHLPNSFKQKVVFDDRGQEIPPALRKSLRREIEKLCEFEYFTEAEWLST